MRFRLSTVFVLVTIVALGAGVTVYSRRLLSFQEVQTLKCGNNDEITFFSKRDSLWDLTHSLYCDVRIDAHLVLTRRKFASGYRHGTYKFEVVSSSRGGGKAVGVLWMPFDDIVECSPDFSNGESWTRQIVAQSLVIIYDFKSGEAFTGLSAYEQAPIIARQLLDELAKWKKHSEQPDVLESIVAVNAMKVRS